MNDEVADGVYFNIVGEWLNFGANEGANVIFKAGGAKCFS